MSAERTRVLELVASGKLTVEQAGELLGALDAPAPAPERPGRGPGRPPRPEPFARMAAMAEHMGHRFGEPRDPREGSRHRAGGSPEREASPYDRIVLLGKYGITPEYVRELKEAGLGELSIEQVIKLGKYGIRAKDVRGFFDAGLEDLTFEHIVMFGKYGIRPDYVRGFVEQGLLGDLTVRALRPDEPGAAEPETADAEPDDEADEPGRDDERA